VETGHKVSVHEINKLVACRSGNAFHPTNEVTLRRAGLLLGWVTACRQVNHLGT